MNASKYRVIAFSTANHPDSWSIEAEDQSWGIVEFKTNQDAKIAEGIFNSMQQEISSLRIRLRNARKGSFMKEVRIEKHGSYVCVRHNGCIDATACTKADCCLLAKGWKP